MIKLSKLKLNPNNPRRISPASLDKLCKSIETDPDMMELRPIVYCPETMTVLGGNQRLEALRKLGYKEVSKKWAVPADKLDEDAKRRFVLKDNAMFGEWDIDVLLADWDDLDLDDFDIELPDIFDGDIDDFFMEAPATEKDKELICPHCGNDVYGEPEE